MNTSMKKILKPRRGGKTTDLIKMSGEGKGVIVVHDYRATRDVLRLASELGIEIPHPVTFTYLLDGRYRGLIEHDFLVDNVELLIDEILRNPRQYDYYANILYRDGEAAMLHTLGQGRIKAVTMTRDVFDCTFAFMAERITQELSVLPIQNRMKVLKHLYDTYEKELLELNRQKELYDEGTRGKA